MIVPSQRLLLLAAVVALPLATAARFVPGLEVPCAVALGLCALVAAADAVRGRMRLDGLAVSAPPVVRLTKDVPVRLPITIASRLTAPLAIRLSVATPAGVLSPECVEETVAPAGASRFDWACTGVARGDHPLRRLYLEAASPFGLWLARSERTVDLSLIHI